MATKIPVDFAGTITLRPKFVDSQGNLGTVDGAPTYQSSNEEILSLQSTPDDPMVAEGTLRGQLGMCQIQVKADADMGDGVKEIVLLGDIEVVPGEVVGGSIEVVLTPAV